MSALPEKTKRAQMWQLADYRDKLRKAPKLRFLFIEMTNLCNENCRHCGSRCERTASDGGDRPLTSDEIKAFLEKTASNFDPRELQLCVTGGEPLLREDFFDVMDHARSLGFRWGMTTNGTLIDEAAARRLRAAGLKTVSVSLDGLPETNDWFRRTKGGFEKALNGIRALAEYGGAKHLQVTTVVHKRNLNELDELYELLKKERLDSWRVINIDPIGRARDDGELMLDADGYRRMFDFIGQHRDDCTLPVTYGCAHYLGTALEGEVRNWYFLCNAGVYTASVMWNGDIGACLDIERRPELIQGNIRRDDFARVWAERFAPFRSDFRRKAAGSPCARCREYKFCAGGAFHTWNFDENRQNVCFKGLLF